jgi:CheY-like chemotaxis protein
MRILVVEDEPDGVEVVQMILAGHVDVSVAHHAEDALKHLQNGTPFDGVIIDLALPGMDGLELLEHIRAMPAIASLPAVAITAFHTPELKAKCLDAGFNGYFAKPLDTAIFLGTLERILGGN